MEHPSDIPEVLGPYAAALKAALSQPFLRLNFATLWVRDQERSRRFFVEKLNFETDCRRPDSRPGPLGGCRSAGCGLAR